MFFIGNSFRPMLGGWRTFLVLFCLKMTKRTKIHGWKYFFASLFSIRIEGGFLQMKPGCWIETGVLLHCIDGKLSIGERTFINKGSVVACMDNISIGSEVLIADYVSIYDHDHGLMDRKKYTTAPVTIGDGAWLGSHSVVLKGVCVGKGSVVAAGSIVTRDIPSFELWGGIPAKFIRKLDEYENSTGS